MQIQYRDGYIHVLLEDTKINPYMFLGWRQRKNDPWYIVEDNIVNRLVLGLPTGLPVRIFGVMEDTTCLKEFQMNDIFKMFTLDHFLNANPMGLGKTVETVRYLKERHARNALIVCPKIIRYQWKSQLERWGNFKAEVFESKSKIKDDGTIWIVNYEQLRRESTRMKFKNFQWQFLVLDEAHKIKNRTSLQTRAVKDIPAAQRIALTGTPILRYVDDLWSILDFLDTRYAGKSYWNFVSYFCEQKETPWGTRIVGMTPNKEKVAILNKLLSLVSIRNESIEVAHGKTREVVRLPMSKAQRELYRKEKNLLLDELPNELTIPNGAVLTLRLMQTTSWPGLFLGNEVGPKFEWVLEMCKNNPTEKFVVFSVFEKTARALTAWLNNNLISSMLIAGSNDTETNELAKRSFVDKDIQVLVGTIGAMGQGYDELQTVCRTMIFIDRDWSPEIMSQAEDRLHRMGQKHLVNIYYLECQGSFDQHVGKINANKASDIRDALYMEE